MPSSIILEEKPIPLAELKEQLDRIEKRDSQLNFRATKAKDYLKKFVKLEGKNSNELIEKIHALNIPRLKERQIAKIADLLPAEIDELRMILSSETTITPENMQQILSIVKEYA